MKVFKSINETVKKNYNNQILEVITEIKMNNYEKIPEFMQIIKYPGKMIRSTFAYITNYLEEEKSHSCLTYLTIIIELMQTASLIHDDIIDNGMYRRGRKTVVNEYGVDSALLLGDCLLFMVMRLVAEMEIGEAPKNQILKSISSCLLCMYEGQKAENSLVGNYKISEKEYFQVISNKTAVFFAMSCELGIIVAGANDYYKKEVVSYGYNLGLAYQMIDDLRSVVHLKNEKNDKSYQTDIERRLVTLPVIMALKECNIHEKKIIKDFYSGESVEKELVVKILNDECVLLKTKEKIINSIVKAKDSLKNIRDSRYKIALQEYCEYLLEEI